MEIKSVKKLHILRLTTVFWSVIHVSPPPRALKEQGMSWFSCPHHPIKTELHKEAVLFWSQTRREQDSPVCCHVWRLLLSFHAMTMEVNVRPTAVLIKLMFCFLTYTYFFFVNPGYMYRSTRTHACGLASCCIFPALVFVCMWYVDWNAALAEITLWQYDSHICYTVLGFPNNIRLCNTMLNSWMQIHRIISETTSELRHYAICISYV